MSGIWAITGICQPRRLIDLHLPRRVGEMVVAANDMGDAHVMIVDDDRKHIGGVSHRSAGERGSSRSGLGQGDPSLHLIVEDGLAILRRLEAGSLA